MFQNELSNVFLKLFRMFRPFQFKVIQGDVFWSRFKYKTFLEFNLKVHMM